MKTTSFDPQAYEIAIRRVVEDGEVLFKGTVKELADVEVYEKNQRAAYDAVVCVIRELHKQALDHGRPFPEPSEVQEEFSGRITLRLTKTVHRQVALAAEREGVSLNHFISTVVSTYVGALFGGYPSHAPTFVHPVDGAVQRARMLSGTGTTWVVQGKAVRFPGETSALSGDLVDVFEPGHVRVRTHELLSLVKKTQPRTLLPSETPETSNAH